MAGAGKSNGMIAQLDKEYIFAKPSKIFPRLLSYFLYEGRPATTKGRWFNPVTFYALRLAAKGKIVPQSENPVFITGTGRSGSTILGLVLSMHPETGFLNEPKALWFFANPNDDLIGSYDSGKAKFMMIASDVSADVKRKVKSIYSSFLIKSGSFRIVDKYPEMIFRVEYLNAIFENPKYIFLYRNPWDTIASTASWSEHHSASTKKEDWWGVNNRKWKLMVEQVVPCDSFLAAHKEIISGLTAQHDKAAVEWIVTMNCGLKMIQKYPKQVFPVRYENLCGNPENTLREIGAFAGLKADETFINYGKQVMHETPLKSKSEIHTVLKQPLLELSQKLGYEIQSPSINVTE